MGIREDVKNLVDEVWNRLNEEQYRSEFADRVATAVEREISANAHAERESFTMSLRSRLDVLVQNEDISTSAANDLLESIGIDDLFKIRYNFAVELWGSHIVSGWVEATDEDKAVSEVRDQISCYSASTTYELEFNDTDEVYFNSNSDTYEDEDVDIDRLIDDLNITVEKA